MSQIELLPVEILRRVCGYLDDAHNFAFVSKTCLSAAQAILYAEVHIYYSSPEALRTSVQQLTKRLESAASFRHVRSLVLEMAHRGSSGVRELPDPAAEDLDARWQNPDVDTDRSMDDEMNERWVPVAELIDKLAGLGELHYTCQPQLAPCILQAIENKTNCRLFLNTFSLRSLIQPVAQPIRPSAYDLRLASSPCLYSIRSVRFEDLDEYGRQNFSTEAVLSMASGIASQLKEVSLCFQIGGGSMDGYMAAKIPPTEWQGDELGRKESIRSKGALRFLELYGDCLCTVKELKKWANATDFSKLKTLQLRNNVGTKILRWLNARDLSSLQSLTLHIRLFWDRHEREEHDPGEKEAEVGRLLVALAARLPPLHTLQITGECSHETIRQILAVQGMSLQRLSFFTKFRSPVNCYDVIDTAGEQWSCPALKELSTAVCRSLGDINEVRQYEWLGANFPNLRRLFLLLDCKGLGQMVKVDKNQLANNPSLKRMYDGKIYNLEHLFRNSAIDQQLLEAIFGRIYSAQVTRSPQLEHLELRMDHRRETGTRPAGMWLMCKYVLGLDQICTRNPWDGHMDVVVANPPSILQSDDVEASWLGISERTMSIFHRVWSEKPEKSWRQTWHSFPLAPDGSCHQGENAVNDAGQDT